MKTYSTKSNALRAAQKAGIDINTIRFTHDLTAGTWAWEPANGTPVLNVDFGVLPDERGDAEAEVDKAIEAGDIEIPEFLRGKKPAAEAIERVMPIAPEAVLAVYNEWVDADPDAFDADAMLAYLTRAYEAGRQAAATKPPRRATEPRTAEPKEGRSPNKRELAAGLLTRPGGATAREILDATGWPAVSVPALAKASRLTLRQEKDGKVTRYYGTASSD